MDGLQSDLSAALIIILPLRRICRDGHRPSPGHTGAGIDVLRRRPESRRSGRIILGPALRQGTRMFRVPEHFEIVPRRRPGSISALAAGGRDRVERFPLDRSQTFRSACRTFPRWAPACAGARGRWHCCAPVQAGVRTIGQDHSGPCPSAGNNSAPHLMRSPAVATPP